LVVGAGVDVDRNGEQDVAVRALQGVQIDVA
jgi:hypothetical protein